MSTKKRREMDELDLSFKVFYDLMAKRVSEILLVSSPYEAFIMEKDGRLAERIIHEYKGLNLSSPPRLTLVSNAREALNILLQKKFDLVIISTALGNMEPYAFSKKIKNKFPNLPIVLLAHNTADVLLTSEYYDRRTIDKIFVWRGNTDLFLAIIKSVEDRLNVVYDTRRAWVRVIIMVEDSPFYISSLLPILYKEIVMQTQLVMDESINEEHRLRRMSARPKILIAENFEEAVSLYRQFAPYLLSALSDVRFQKNGKIDDEAGFALVSMIKKEFFDLPLLIFSSEASNREKALKIPAVFINKNSTSLHADIRSFFVQHLGFGDFIFKLPNGKEVTRASNLRSMEKILPTVPDESVYYHAMHNDFSNWLMARCEILLASKLRPLKAIDFSSAQEIKDHLVASFRERRLSRQKGIVSDFAAHNFDPDMDFIKLGDGSLGGKARGLAFISELLQQKPEFQEKYPEINISIPKTLVISTDGFDSFIGTNNLKDILSIKHSDIQIKKMFLNAHFPDWIQHNLKLFLNYVNYPLAVRSSSILEDAQFHPYAGIYHTYMIPNNHPELAVRLQQLIIAIKLVYASTYLEVPRSFTKSTLYRIEEEKMAVIIQQITGTKYAHYFYPSLSGVAQSYNFYPFSYMKPEEGIAYIAMGLGKTVVEGGTALRFSPKYPQLLPQFSTVEDILKNSQRFFYALNLADFPYELIASTDDATLSKLEIYDVSHHAPAKFLCSSYIPEDHRIRDTADTRGYPVLTFAGILKYNLFPLPAMLSEILNLGQAGMGAPVEMEFAFNLPVEKNQKPDFSMLQIRPMPLIQHNKETEITNEDINNAFCYSTQSLGNGVLRDIYNIVFVKPEVFDPAHTIKIASEIKSINKLHLQKNQKYLLIGPGRWGSSDRWLGIPVRWNDISGVAAIVETEIKNLRPEPSQGSHFFHNITSLGISYITVYHDGKSFLDWNWLKSLPAEIEMSYVKNVSLEKPITIKINGKKSCAVLLIG